MAYGYWKTGRAEKRAVFHHFFRERPFGSGFTVTAGLEQALDVLAHFIFDASDIDYLSTLVGADGNPLFESGFLDYLGSMRCSLDVDAVPEGTVVFPHEPLVRVTGPILQAQLVETVLLTIMNFQTLIATKAARVTQASAGDPVIEFGLRRAQGIDGGLAASRAAFIGGCEATSNTLAGKLYGIPVRGTHAHSWTMSFDTELEAFEAYAESMPNNCIFLVDTYDTLSGVENAIKAGRKLRSMGGRFAGIRLDSGDLAYLSIEARRMLDEAGFEDAVIVASNELDETIIESLKRQGAAVAVWGVGTKLATGWGQGALGGVYKLSAVEEEGGWVRKLKLSEQAVKVNNPGILNVRRFFDEKGRAVADAIYDIEDHGPKPWTIVDPVTTFHRKSTSSEMTQEDLLVPIMRMGKPVYESPPISEIQARAGHQMGLFHPGIRRFVNPHVYPVGLESRLFQIKTELMEAERDKVEKIKGKA